MEYNEPSHTLDYNTTREKLAMPEYGRNVLKMVEQLKALPDKDKRTEQARAIVKVMELLNPQVHSQDNFEHKLWDHLYMIAGFDLDVDSPYPCPVAETFNTDPVPIPMKGSKIRAFLAIYMRTQYLIWNKDSVADETIFADIEKMSDYRLRVPEGLSLSKIAGDANFSRPGMGINVGQPGSGQRKRKNNYKRPFKKK